MPLQILDKIIKNKRIEHIPIANIIQVIAAINEAEMEIEEDERIDKRIRPK